MYEGPIKITRVNQSELNVELPGVLEDITNEICKTRDEYIKRMVVHEVEHWHIDVDEQELLKALQYDRHQYEQGYKDGIEEGKKQKAQRIIEILEEYLEGDRI